MAQAALDLKAEDLVILNLQKLSFSFDFFLLCSASSERRIRAIADHVQEKLSKKKEHPRHLEGHPEGGWMLLDYGTVVGHIFSSEARQFYSLERLWADAPRLKAPRRRITKHQIPITN